MRFQDFEIKPDERLLLIHDQEALLGARAFDVLVALASRYKQVVSKQTLLDIVWPDVIVEENNLQVQVSTLRKLLGPKVITTLPGRGYCLTAAPLSASTPVYEPVSEFELTALPQMRLAKAKGNLPANIPDLYGRDADVRALSQLLEQHRLVSVTGTGGVGKTHLAKCVAALRRDDWSDGVWWLDGGAVQDGSLVESLAHCLRVGLQGGAAPLDELVLALQSKQLLLVLDNCEHLLDSARQVTTILLNKAPDVQVLVTSQARLRVAGEHVYQLGTLAVPDQLVSASDALAFGAIRLFVQRVQQLDRHFSLQPSTLPDVIVICQQLDGVALSIELAAARVPMLGVHGVRERLSERLRLLGNATTLSETNRRQVTMRATLDWSHHLLNNDQAQMFRRLSVFVGSFSLAAAQRLLCDEGLDEWAMMGVLESLIDQSLVVVSDEESVRYRLLETHRVYAYEKLQEASEVSQWQYRLAVAMLALSKQLVKDRGTRALWDEMNHIRATFDWAAAQHDDVSHELAIALATASSMVLAVSGYVGEALQRLLVVEPWVDKKTPKALASRYWQWLGRCGVHGRLSTSRCIDAFIKSEKLFQSMDAWRHVHACRRMRAEALLDSYQLAEAKLVLLEAQAMEAPDWPVADRMRRLKVQALLAGQTGQDTAALRLARQALSLAEQAGIERYVLAIQLDIANLHLKTGEHGAALLLFRKITGGIAQHHYNRLTIAQAHVGLMTALLDQGELEEAGQACLLGLPYWRSSGILLKHADLFAGWLASVEQPFAAIRMLGAANAFFSTREMVREAMTQKIHETAMQGIAQQIPSEELDALLNESYGLINEDVLASHLEQEIHRYLET